VQTCSESWDGESSLSLRFNFRIRVAAADHNIVLNRRSVVSTAISRLLYNFSGMKQHSVLL